ncbi:MAG TPA: hypothetical protein VFZ53_07075 [Polyangiaceae bacterium]
MRSRAIARVAVGALASALFLGAGSLHAEPNATQRAAAEALFQRGAELMDAAKYAEACEKFQASQELDPTLGTMLYLADCYDRAGKTASSWALFQEAAQKARRGGQFDRERIASERAQDLQKRLSLLDVRVAKKHLVPGLTLTINGVSVPQASLNTPLPVDPGSTRVEARAPGKKPWAATFALPVGPVTRVLEIGPLADEPLRAASPAAGGERRDEPRSSNVQATLGYVTGAAGIAALVAGGFFAYRAYDQNRRSKAECRADDPNACTEEGVELRDSAKQSAAFSTIATVSGAALVAGGVVIVLTAPSASSSRERTALPRGAELSIRGVF